MSPYLILQSNLMIQVILVVLNGTATFRFMSFAVLIRFRLLKVLILLVNI